MYIYRNLLKLSSLNIDRLVIICLGVILVVWVIFILVLFKVVSYNLNIL